MKRKADTLQPHAFCYSALGLKGFSLGLLLMRGMDTPPVGQ